MSTPAPNRAPRHLDQLNSTALKWASDGELSSLDLERIMRRLAAVDPAVQSLQGSAALQGSVESAAQG